MDNLMRRPEDLVDCWHDNERMDFLFSSFPADSASNREHWESKLKFWSDLITKLCDSSASICVDVDVVGRWVERNGRRPMGLQVVWDAMVRDGRLVPTQEYVGDMARNSSWVGWGLNTFVRKPSLWMAGKMLSPLKTFNPIKSVDQKKPFICLKIFKQKCEKLMQTLQSCTSNTHGHLHIVSLNQLEKLSQNIVTDPKELEMLLLSLERDKKVAVFNRGESKISEKFVKFAKNIDECVTPVNEGDMGVVKLEHTRQALEKQVTHLYSQQKELLDTARGYIRDGERGRAKSTLRHKQRVELNIKRKESSLDNIQQLLFRLEECGTDQMVLDAYRAGVSAYKEASKGMTIDDVDTTMDDVQAVMDDHEQITSTLSTFLDDDVIASDLEQELDDLLAEEEGLVSNQTDDDIANLGLPSGPPLSSPQSRDRGDEVVSNQTDADIAKLVTGMAAANMSATNFNESPSRKTSTGRTPQTLS